uniref:Integrase catalytic domain-containing protein n=1 Tax=Nothobranchius kuhntae TaxID=321403 RepID=A0A1A8HQZ4_NOTKU
MDNFTKWPEADTMPHQSAASTAQRLVDEMFSRFGVPEEMDSDRGETLRASCSSDGLVQRFNRTLATQLAILTNKHQRDWDLHLSMVLWAYRTAVQESSQSTPAALMFGRELRTPVDLVFGPAPEPDIVGGPELDYERMEEVHQLARTTLLVAGARQKRAYDSRAHGPSLALEDKVWVYCPTRKKGLSPKLMRHWQGPT